MCSRYTLTTRKLADPFGLNDNPTLDPRYNIAPTQPVPIIRLIDKETGRQLVLVRWGLIPPWAEDEAVGSRMINARSETAATKPSFRSAFKRQRCLVVADGFYEWKRIKDGKQPYHMRMKDGRPFGFAGLWSRWERGKRPVESCTILTTEPNAVLKKLHDRMPVIVAPADYEAWLDPGNQDAEDLQPLLRPYPAKAMEAYPVSKRVNNPKNEGPGCVRPSES